MAKRNEKDAPQQPSFEQAMAELEELIEKIEAGQVGLEECLTHYERGMTLIARCKAVLGAAQTKIAELNIGPDGSLRSFGSSDADETMEGDFDDEEPDGEDDESQERF